MGLRSKISTMQLSYQTGDIVTAQVHKLPFLNHMGIVVVDPVTGEVTIWHNTPNNHNSLGGSVMKHPLSVWTKTRTITKLEHSDLTNDYIESQVRTMIEKPFNWIFFNCEHFTYQIWKGKPESPQLVFWGGFTAVVTALLVIGKKKPAFS